MHYDIIGRASVYLTVACAVVGTRRHPGILYVGLDGFVRCIVRNITKRAPRGSAIDGVSSDTCWLLLDQAPR